MEDVVISLILALAISLYANLVMLAYVFRAAAPPPRSKPEEIIEAEPADEPPPWEQDADWWKKC